MKSNTKNQTLADELRAHLADQGPGDYARMLRRILAALEEKDRALNSAVLTTEAAIEQSAAMYAGGRAARVLAPTSQDSLRTMIEQARAALRAGEGS